MSPLLLSFSIFVVAVVTPPHSAVVFGRKHDSHHDRAAPASDLVHTSCVHANYPNLCLRTLAGYSGPAQTPRDIAKAAVNVSLARASRVSKYLARTVAASSSSGGSKRRKAALADCVEQIGDSVEELRKTLEELGHLRRETFWWQMSNAETWVSAALTNEDTCLDGFHGVGGGSGKIKADVRRKVTNVARVTSNALYMINLLDETSRNGTTP